MCNENGNLIYKIMNRNKTIIKNISSSFCKRMYFRICGTFWDPELLVLSPIPK